MHPAKRRHLCTAQHALNCSELQNRRSLQSATCEHRRQQRGTQAENVRIELQGWAVKVVQGDIGGRPDAALAARAMYIAEVNQTKPLWAAWRAKDTQFVR